MTTEVVFATLQANSWEKYKRGRNLKYEYTFGVSIRNQCSKARFVFENKHIRAERTSSKSSQSIFRYSSSKDALKFNFQLQNNFFFQVFETSVLPSIHRLTLRNLLQSSDRFQVPVFFLTFFPQPRIVLHKTEDYRHILCSLTMANTDTTDKIIAIQFTTSTVTDYKLVRPFLLRVY